MNQRIFSILELGFYIITPIVLLCLPAGYFDQGQSLCLSQLLFQKECPGCGMTRAVMHLIHFDLNEAVYYNPFVLIIFPLLVFFVARRMLKLWKSLRKA